MQRIQTFQASSMREALRRVKRELGEEAVILGTRTRPSAGLGSLVGRTEVEITAARRNVQAPPRPAVPPLSDHAYPYYCKLVQNEVAEQLAVRLARRAATLAGSTSSCSGRPPSRPSTNSSGCRIPSGVGDRQAVCRVLQRTIAQMIPAVGGIRLRNGAFRRVAFVGPTGAGKTTTLAKLAAHFALRLRKRVAIVSLDTRGLGSNEQLRRYAEIIGVPMYAAQSGADVKRLFQRVEPVDLVLIDTHGVCANDRRHLAGLTAMLDAARPDEIHLVLPACMLPSVQARVAETFAPVGVTRVVLTRLDEAVGLGVLLNTIDKLSCGLSYLTNGESVPNHIEEACAEHMAALILPMDK